MRFNPKKILVVLHGSIGDVIRAIPLANLVRRGFPQAKIAWSIERPALPLIEHHPAVDEIILFERDDWRRGLRPFLGRVRAGNFDRVLDLQRHLKSGLVSWWSRAPERVGFHRRDAKEFNWLFNNRHIPAAEKGASKLAHYLKFAELLGIEPYPVEWKFHLLPEEEAKVASMQQSIGGPFAAFCVGSRWESKRWFADETTKCAAEIKKRYGLEIFLLGGREDAAFAREIENSQNAPAANWVGRTSLREAIGIVSRAEVAIGPDSGLMHLSAAVGTPVVSLRGATDPLRTGPYGFQDLVIRGKASCSPCYLRRCPIGRLCMRSITGEEVLTKVGKALAGRGKCNDA
jgi:heptosyltransferase-1